MNNEHLEEEIRLLLKQWDSLKETLFEHFQNKDRKSALAPMEDGIHLFLKFLYWSNHCELKEEDAAIEDFKWKPINVVERLHFIKSKPNLFHSFIQLTELMTEQEKQFRKKMALKQHKQ